MRSPAAGRWPEVRAGTLRGGRGPWKCRAGGDFGKTAMKRGIAPRRKTPSVGGA